MRIIYVCLLLLLAACEKEELVNNQPEQAQTENEMAKKILNAYGGFTAQQIKDRAEIPIQAYMTVVGNTVECVQVPISVIKGILASSSTSVGGLCTDANVNQWSGFGPREWYVNNGVLINRLKTPYEMGYFAGYNHDALSPLVSGKTETININSGQQTSSGVTCSFELSEIDWTQYALITQIGFVSKIGSTVLATTYYSLAFSEVGSGSELDLQNTFDLSYTQNQTITSELFFANAAGVKVASIPNVPTFNTSVIVGVVAEVGAVELAGALENPSIFLNVNSATVDQSNETYSIQFAGIYDESIPAYVSANYSLYARLNEGSYITCSKVVSFNGTNTLQTVTGTLPFSIGNNDVVYFELR